jgi:Ca2+-binding RTX toxin-like protein
MSMSYFDRRWAGTNGNDRFFGFDQFNPGFTLLASFPDVFPGRDSIAAGDGDDEVNGPGGNNRIFGEAGNDTLTGAGNSDLLDGGAGANDVLYGGAGNDTLVEMWQGGNQDSAAILDGGEGFDTLQLFGSARFAATQMTGIEVLRVQTMDVATVTLSALNFAMFQLFQFYSTGNGSTVTIQGLGGTYDFSRKAFEAILGGAVLPAARFLGSAGDERVIGTDRADEIRAEGGANRVLGGAGNDSLRGAGTIAGGEGADTVTDHAGTLADDRLSGGAGDDRLISNNGADTLFGEDGNDSLQGSGGGDLLNGGAGNDTLLGAAFGAPDTLLGGDGDDLLRDSGLIGAGHVLNGGAGADTLEATGATLAGAEFVGIEVLAVAGRTVISPEALARFGTLSLAQGSFFDAFAAGRYDFRAKAIIGNGVFFQGTLFEDDTVFGSAGADTLRGLGGNDVLFGDSGDDVLAGSSGNDLMDGGAGFDAAVFVLARENYTITQLGGGRIQVSGLEGADTLRGIEELRFADGVIPVATGLGETVRGGAGGDSLNGLGGNDTIEGRGGADTLLGAAGNDLLIGGAADDRLAGGSGADTFLMALPSDGVDRILDFTSGEDRLAFGAAGFGLPAGALDPARFELTGFGFGTGIAGSFVYRSEFGQLWFEADGEGGAPIQLVAVLAGTPILTAGDIWIV